MKTEKKVIGSMRLWTMLGNIGSHTESWEVDVFERITINNWLMYVADNTLLESREWNYNFFLGV